MRTHTTLNNALRTIAGRCGFIRLAKDERGVTAIEFAALAPAFFMFVFGLIGISLYYFTMISVEKGMDSASRKIRTGQAQNSPMTVADFKQEICDSAGRWVDCSYLQVFTDPSDDWTEVQPKDCVYTDEFDGKKKMSTNSTPANDLLGVHTGGPSQIVTVTACYRWMFSSKLPMFKLGNLSDVEGARDGSLMMQSSTAFRTEPFTPATPED